MAASTPQRSVHKKLSVPMGSPELAAAAPLWGRDAGRDALPRLGCERAHLVLVPYTGMFNL